MNWDMAPSSKETSQLPEGRLNTSNHLHLGVEEIFCLWKPKYLSQIRHDLLVDNVFSSTLL